MSVGVAAVKLILAAEIGDLVPEDFIEQFDVLPNKSPETIGVGRFFFIHKRFLVAGHRRSPMSQLGMLCRLAFKAFHAAQASACDGLYFGAGWSQFGHSNRISIVPLFRSRLVWIGMYPQDGHTFGSARHSRTILESVGTTPCTATAGVPSGLDG